MKVEVCLHCYNYQKRLCWMLNSLLQQKGDLPDILVNISYCSNNGNPKTEDVIRFFKNNGLKIKETIVESNSAHNRSRARERQLAETDADWIIFADSDMAYSKEFFSDLKSKLSTEDYCKETLCMGADRVSLSIPHSVKFFSEDKTVYPCIIDDVESIVSKWPVYRTGGKNTAAGYFQLGNVKTIRERKLTYPIKSRDGLRTYKADRAFRCVMGGRRGIDLKPQYHLNHTRGTDNEQR